MSGYPTNRALDIWLFRGYHPINLSRGPEVSAGMSRRHSWIAPVACAAIAITLLFWFYLSRYRADQRAVTSAQDEVYEAVVRDMVSPTNGQAEMHQLVFDDTVQTGLMSGADAKTCEERVRKQLRLLENSTPPFNSLADKIYRVLTRGGDDGGLRADTVQDFLTKFCTEGPLSRTFHTDFPRVFIDSGSVFFDIVPTNSSGVKDFRQTFSESSGVISLSHVGFSSTLHEALVSSSFVCGGLCGTGRLYILKKKWGRWEVTGISIVWIS